MRPTGAAWAVIASLVVAGCGSSPPSRFYTLSSVPPTAQLAARGTPSGVAAPSPPLSLGKVTLPSIVVRSEIATRISPTRLDFSDTQRWAAPLDELVRQALADDLSARMTPQTAIANAATPLLNLDITEFDADPAGVVTLDARWDVTSGPQATLPLSAERFHLRLPSKAADVDDVAATMSQALGMLADRVIALARTLR